jgi:hypothetical protein
MLYVNALGYFPFWINNLPLKCSYYLFGLKMDVCSLKYVKSLKIVQQLGGFSTSFKNPTKFVIFSLNQLNKYLWNMLRFLIISFFFFFFSPRYQFLEYVCAKRLKFEPNSICFMGTKLLADTFLYGPMHLLVFFLLYGFGGWKHTRANEARYQT